MGTTDASNPINRPRVEKGEGWGRGAATPDCTAIGSRRHTARPFSEMGDSAELRYKQDSISGRRYRDDLLNGREIIPVGGFAAGLAGLRNLRDGLNRIFGRICLSRATERKLNYFLSISSGNKGSLTRATKFSPFFNVNTIKKKSMKPIGFFLDQYIFPW